MSARPVPSEAELFTWFETLSNWQRFGPDDERGTLNLIDDRKRAEIFAEFQKVVDESVTSIIAYSALHANGVRREVEGFSSTPMQWLELTGVSVKR